MSKFGAKVTGNQWSCDEHYNIGDVGTLVKHVELSPNLFTNTFTDGIGLETLGLVDNSLNKVEFDVR